MFDKYIVCEEGFRRLDDGRTGGRIEVRMPYYRGLGLSMVEAVNLVLDGTPVPPERTTFTVHGHTYTFAELPAVLATGGRWVSGRSWPSRPTSRSRLGSTTSPSRSGCASRTCPSPAGEPDRKRLDPEGLT